MKKGAKEGEGAENGMVMEEGGVERENIFIYIYR